MNLNFLFLAAENGEFQGHYGLLLYSEWCEMLPQE
jgi:hypothetical protein